MTIRELRKGKNKNDYFKLVNSKGEESKTIYFCNGYVKEIKKFSISPFEDVNKEKFVKPTQEITTDFIF